MCFLPCFFLFSPHNGAKKDLPNPPLFHDLPFCKHAWMTLSTCLNALLLRWRITLRAALLLWQTSIQQSNSPGVAKTSLISLNPCKAIPVAFWKLRSSSHYSRSGIWETGRVSTAVSTLKRTSCLDLVLESVKHSKKKYGVEGLGPSVDIWLCFSW